MLALRLLRITGLALFVTCAPGLAAELDEPIKPLPSDLKLDARKVDLGRVLFAETRLAQDQTVA